MSRQPPEYNSQSPLPESKIEQRNDGSTNGGMQGIVGSGNTQTQDHRNWVTNIVNNFFPGDQHVESNLQFSRSKLLRKVQQQINYRLEHSLHGVLINLGKEQQPENVKCPWAAEVKIGSKPPESLANNISILDIFDRNEIGGKLLILGNPGSGKTTTMLELAKALIDRQQLLPMLDGLDELQSSRQESCVLAINEFLQTEYNPQYLVVCSRYEEYKSHKCKLQLNVSIYLKPLRDNQIKDYLAQLQKDYIWDELCKVPHLYKFVRTPLWLSILVLSAPERVFQSKRHFEEADVESYLLDTYVNRMLKRDIYNHAYAGKNISLKEHQIRCWLKFLASKMQEGYETEFLIEDMQTSYLSNRQCRWQYQWQYQFIYVPINRLILAKIFGIILFFI